MSEEMADCDDVPVDEGLLMVPEALLEEEARVRAANEEEDETEAAAARTGPDELTTAQRYDKLMALLGKSSIYSKYLLKKIEDDDAAAELKRRKVEDRKKLKEKQKKQGGRGQKRSANKRHSAELLAKKLKPELSRMFEGEDIPDEQPLLLSGGVMRDYQIKGFQWVSTLFENDINGILADEMGLGKTIQTIALFCHLVEMGVPGPFLVVAPLSTVPNWIKEFKRFAPLFPTVLYHGNKKEREDLRYSKLKESAIIEGIDKEIRNVFVTSYEIVMNDRRALANVKWRFIVVDEGHRLKNMNCKLIKQLKLYHSVNKLLLTGTPLQNNLSELWSLLNFIMPEIFDDLRVFESWFDAKEIHQNESESERIVMQEKQNNILSTLHQILTPFLLRRVKADVDLQIPPKKEVLVYCPMTVRQRDLYEATVNRTIKELLGGDVEKVPEMEVDLVTGRSIRNKVKIDYAAFFSEGESESSFDQYLEKLSEQQQGLRLQSAYNYEKAKATSEVRVSLKNRLADLRKATNHPYLIEHPLNENGVFYQAEQDMIDVCGKMKVLDQMLEALLGRQHKVLIFSQMTRMLDILGDYLNLKKYKFSRLDGTMHFEDRQENIDSFNEDPDVKIFLLSTRAGGLGINLTAADTCIIYDSDWNPQQDLQAQDRCHRIGQTKPVMVYRLVTANTIDQKIVERAAAKRKLEKLIIHSKKFKSQDSAGLKKTMEAISPQELLELLNSKDHAGEIDRADGAVFSLEELESLLDRSEMNWVKMAAKKKKEMFKMIDDEEARGGVLMSVKEG